ncbi:MAG TPA: glycosyltransferase family 9 protein [Bordetella sp.]
MPAISRLYVRLPNWVGDVCMSLPALHLLQQAGPPLVLCARPWALDLLAGLPAHDFVALRGKLREDRAAVAAHRRALGREARAARGLLIPDSLSSALVFRLAGLPSAGFRDEGRSMLLRWPIAKPGPALHTVQAWHYLARTALRQWSLPAASDAPGPRLGLPLTAAHREAARALLREQGLDGRPFVLIAPTAVGLHHGRVKVWPHFDALTRALQADGHTVIMCPPPAEAGQARANAPTATLLAPLGLGAYAALAAQARLVVCNDSGVSHIAAAVGARQLTLFGVTQASRTGPWSPTARGLGSDLAWPEIDAVRQTVDGLLAEG